jgi:hypothetical protein
MKKIISLIDHAVYITTGSSIQHHFIVKYHESHNLSTYRLILTIDTFDIEMVKQVLNTRGVDVMCVATHYSDRYSSADEYLTTYVDAKYTTHIMFLHTNNIDSIIHEFIDKYIETYKPNTGLATGDVLSPSHAELPKSKTTQFVSVPISSISWKNMHYLWKLYLHDMKIPNMIYTTYLQSKLTVLLEHVTEGSSITFTNMSSKYLPHVSSFLQFWEKYMTIVHEPQRLYKTEYEIDELLTLYKQTEMKSVSITEDTMVRLIHHYFSPDVQVIEHKYITNIQCSLWNKNDNIYSFLSTQMCDDTLSILPNNDAIGNEDKPSVSDGVSGAPHLVSIDDLYKSYTLFIRNLRTKSGTNILTASKHYFLNHIQCELSNYIYYDNFVDMSCCSEFKNPPNIE